MEFRRLYRRTVAASFAVAILSLPNSALFYLRLQQEQATAKQLTIARQKIEAIDELLTQLLNLETGMRGYGATGDKQFLQPYWEGRRQVPVALVRLERLERESDALRAKVLTVLALSQVAIQKGATPAQFKTGKVVMDEIRSILARNKTENTARCFKLIQAREDREHRDLYLGVLSAIITLLLLWLVYKGATSMKLAFRKAEKTLSLEEKLRVSTQKLLAKEKELSQAKSAIISTISHEYRTPLTAIRTAAELLKNDLATERKALYIEQIRLAVKRLAALVDEVLEAFQLQSGVITLHYVPISLAAWMQGLIESLDGSDRVILDIQIKEICCDEALLHKILSNLLSNALKYSSVKEAVFVRIKPMGGGIQIRVKDRGIGIPRSMRLYQPFERGSNVGSIQGTGLGLSIVKKAVDLLAGSIAVQSEEGEGTTFSVILPP